MPSMEAGAKSDVVRLLIVECSHLQLCEMNGSTKNIVAQIITLCKDTLPSELCWSRNIDVVNNMILSIDEHPWMLQLVILLSIKTDAVTPIWQRSNNDNWPVFFFQSMQHHNLVNDDKLHHRVLKTNVIQDSQDNIQRVHCRNKAVWDNMSENWLR
jgi:hypothetical protein